ncbi:carboxylesterase/lipase family protein [Streptomyces flavofungini]|uniref:Carboxylic ester hydrolase n=1 Tax=Streptomyces flavofungini TaxID=68200 RepID=A0ABS0X7U0_9ACTN|nr:carboxylesterase family protein [Streptomyces flavofungini]MBJ3809270.1 carboxylesterase/lipase family protein [Streptomyces flavofungini]GHC77289.1 carboxylic ester hydrolase [Streptomyces flavofungini]
MSVAASQSFESQSAPVVRTAAGTVRGSREGGLAVFRGIPFAEPPVGELRFAAPRAVRGWDGEREAVAYGPPPPQAGVFGMDALSEEAPGDDWLTVNVWSPDPGAGAGLPVLVWIQGGAYVIGMSGLPEYDGGRLAREGGVVVVTFNYRVGIEGFAQIEGAPANRGLLDQVAALEWVRDNIRGFGGDPDRVTVFGQSAGGGSVAALLAMGRARGLFRRAVAQSVQGTYFSPELAADVTAACAAELSLRPTVAELSTVDPTRLSATGDAITAKIAQWAERWGRPGHRTIPFAAVVDGDVLPTTPWQALAGGAARDIELIAGHARDEHRLFGVIDGTLGQVTEEQAATALGTFAPGPDGPRRYRDALPDAGPNELYERVHADWLFRMPSLHLAESQLQGGGRAHLYELTWPAPGMGGVLGACHGLDVPLVFGNLAHGQTAALLGEGPSPEAESLSAHIRGAWTAFATHGDPGWPAYDTAQRLTQLFDTHPTVAPDPEKISRLLWQDHAFEALPLLDR